MSERRGLLIILSSPSGAGKSTLARRLMAWDSDIQFSVSATTRAPRPGETDGVEYHFMDRGAFDQAVAEGGMLEHAEVFGEYYGSPKAPVAAASEAGRDVLFDVDWQGGQQIRASSLGAHCLSVFILPPSIAELERRLVARGQDQPDVIARRMRKARDEISHWPEYDFVLINDDIETSAAKLITIVEASRLRLSQTPGVVEHVRRLNAEFEARKDQS